MTRHIPPFIRAQLAEAVRTGKKPLARRLTKKYMETYGALHAPQCSFVEHGIRCHLAALPDRTRCPKHVYHAADL